MPLGESNRRVGCRAGPEQVAEIDRSLSQTEQGIRLRSGVPAGRGKGDGVRIEGPRPHEVTVAPGEMPEHGQRLRKLAAIAPTVAIPRRSPPVAAPRRPGPPGTTPGAPPDTSPPRGPVLVRRLSGAAEVGLARLDPRQNNSERTRRDRARHPAAAFVVFRPVQ